MIVKNKDLLKQLENNLITAGLLREFLAKDLIPEAIKAVNDQISLRGSQINVLVEIRGKLRGKNG